MRRPGRVGTTIVTRYPELASISMVLVAECCARQGHARRLVSHVLDTGVSTLVATSTGRPLYEQLGFHTVGFTDIHAGAYTGPVSDISHIATPAAFVREHGLESFGEYAWMVRGADQLPGDRARYHAPILQSLD